MKFGLASDLHLDFGDINPEFFDWRGDVLLLAGDITEDDFMRKHCHSFFDSASKMAEHVLVISGNHEYYRSELDVADDHIEQFLEEWTNVIPLRNRAIKLGHVSIFGGTMWTDFHGSPIAEWQAQQNLNDYRYIRMKRKNYGKILPRDVLTEYQRCYNAMLNWLEQDTTEVKLVMTHHAPSVQSVPPAHRRDYELNKAYCNHFEGLIENHPEIAAWVHGHTHDFFDYQIGQTQIKCNPRGYPGERPAHLPPYMPMEFTL